MRRWAVVVAFAIAALAATTAPSATAAGPTVVTVDLSSPGPPANPNLGGLSWNDGHDLTPIADLHPSTIRVDANLQDVSPSEGVVDTSTLEARIAEIRRVGAEPLVILCYMPRWLGARNAYGRDATKVAPYDLVKWEQLVAKVVDALATAGAPAYRFEVWNEPDLPTFFQDSPTAFLDMAAATHRAVASVKADHPDLPIRIGGPATAAPDPAFITAYAQRMVHDDLPLDFISWHYYANHPFFGPNGNEGFVPEPLYQANARRNPLASPRLFGDQPALVRAMLAGPLAGTERNPELVLTEWNLSAGGYDFRHATYEGAAFVVGTLIELERGGLDAADFYRALAASTPNAGDWAVATQQGARRPSWWALQAWNDATADAAVLPVTGDNRDDGFWAHASRRADGQIDVLLASFSSSQPAARRVDVNLAGTCPSPSAEIGRLDATSSDLATYTPTVVTGGVVHVDLPAQSAAFLRVHCGAVTAG